MEDMGKGQVRLHLAVSSSSDQDIEEVEEEKKRKNKNNKAGRAGDIKAGGGKARQSAEHAARVLMPEDLRRMVDLGLGRGVDATDPSPWLNKSAFQVREVTPHNILSTEEGGVLQSFGNKVASMQSMQTKLSTSVPASQQVSVGVDAELSRNYSTNRSVGKKIITRSISYRADFDDIIRRKSMTGPTPLEYPRDAVGRRRSGEVVERILSISRVVSSDSSDEPPSALTFEQRLARWIVERLVDEEVPGAEELNMDEEDEDPTQLLATFIAEWPPSTVADVKKLLAHKCREFVNHFRITHYVSSIELGAAKYRVMSEEEYQTQVGLKGNLGVEQIVGAAVERKASFGRRTKSTEVTKIGHFEGNRVRRGTTDEAVVGVKFQPISALVKMRILQNKLQNAIQSYIDNQEHSKAGPFVISCHDETIFLQVTPDFRVVGTTNIKDSSDFFIGSNEDGESPYEFSIMYMAASPLKDRGIEPISRYLYAPVNTFGNNSGPLTLRLDAKDTKTKMMLHSRRTHHFNPVDTADWISSKDIFYLNCKQRSVKKNGYISVKRSPPGAGRDEEYITCCVPSIKTQSDTRDRYMLFRLLRANKKEAPKARKEEEEDEPLGVKRWTRKTSKYFSIEEEYGLTNDRQSTGEDTVDAIRGKGRRRGEGKGSQKEGTRGSAKGEEGRKEEGKGRKEVEGSMGGVGERKESKRGSEAEEGRWSRKPRDSS